MNFLIPLGAAAGGALQGLATTRLLQEQERLREQQEFEKALGAFTQVITSPNMTPETFEYMIKMLGPKFQKQGVTLPPMPQIKPKAMRDFETQLEIFKILKHKHDTGEITDEQYYTALSGKPDVPEKEVTIPFKFGDKIYNIGIPASKAADIISKFMLLQEQLAAGVVGGRGRREKAPSGFGADILRDAQAKLQSGDIAGAQALVNVYNSIADRTGATQFRILEQDVGGKKLPFLWAKDTELPTKKEAKKLRPDEQARKQGLNLVPF